MAVHYGLARVQSTAGSLGDPVQQPTQQNHTVNNSSTLSYCMPERSKVPRGCVFVHVRSWRLVGVVFSAVPDDLPCGCGDRFWCSSIHQDQRRLAASKIRVC